MFLFFSFKALPQKHAARTAKPAACPRAIHNHGGGRRGRGGLCPWCQTQGSRGVARPFYRLPGFRRADPKIPGRQGLARGGEPRCCLCPAAVITPPNLESSGRAACSAAIRRLFNCGVLFPSPWLQLPTTSPAPALQTQAPGLPSLCPRALTPRCCTGTRAWHPKSDPSHAYGTSWCIHPGKKPPELYIC